MKLGPGLSLPILEATFPWDEKVFPREKEGLSIRNAPRAGLFQLGQRFGKISESQVIFLLTIGDINEDMVCKSNANLFL